MLLLVPARPSLPYMMSNLAAQPTLFRRSASDLGAKPATIARPRPESSSIMTPIGRGRVTETSLLGPGNSLQATAPLSDAARSSTWLLQAAHTSAHPDSC